jgi:SAM-dependent methyltransferase
MDSFEKMKKYFSRLTLLKVPYVIYFTLKQQYGLSLNWLKGLFDIIQFSNEYRIFQSNNDNDNFELKMRNWLPCLIDKTELTPVEPVYFLQDTWAASKIFQLKPEHHYDVGSSVKTIGIISQFVPVTMIDIRPIDIELKNLYFKEGSVLELPFEDNSIESLSSLCVIEHIGLGRYGDPLDSWGSEKAIKELKRVVKRGGIMLFSVPVDETNKVYFNAHRAFTRDYVLQLFDGFELLEEKYQYGRQLYDSYDPSKGFGTGLYMFKKEEHTKDDRI